MVSIVKIDLDTGLGLSVQRLPEDVYLSLDDQALSVDGQRLALVGGAVTRVWDLRGASAFGGEDGRQPATIPNDPAMIGLGWADLAATKSAGHPFGLLKDPRPLTRAEQAARAKAEADAKAQADAAALAALEITAVQARLAANDMGIRDDIERVVSAPATDRAVKNLWEYSTTFRRSHPLWERFAPMIGKTSADIDAFFKLARTR